MARPPTIDSDTALRLVLNVGSVRLTDDQFFQLCSDNRELFFEMTARGELLIMSPNMPESDRKNARITMRLGIWSEQDGTGECFGATAVFTLPNGAKRSPDGAWIPKTRWRHATKQERDRFHRICPDFVIELRSISDRVRDLQEKMEEYIANGAKLGWLLDPIDNCATIYRPGEPPQRIDRPGILTGDPVLPGFQFDFTEIL